MKKAILFIATLFNHCTYLKHIQSKFAYRDSYRCYYSHRDIAMLSCRSNKSLIIAILCFSLILVSCDDEDHSTDIETKYLYINLPAKFDVVKTWFTNNPTTPTPPANTKVEITEGNNFETDYNIGNYYYEIEIDDYFSIGTKYDVEFYLDSSVAIIAVIVNEY